MRLTPAHLEENHPDIYRRYVKMYRMMYEAVTPEDQDAADIEEMELNAFLSDTYNASERDLDDLSEHVERLLGL